VIDRLARALATAMKTPETLAALEKAGLEPYYQSPDASRQQVERETDVVLAAAKKLGLAN
jgi:tripartite-type tricarboxylate transporter receptor subunit TctC